MSLGGWQQWTSAALVMQVTQISKLPARQQWENLT